MRGCWRWNGIVPLQLVEVGHLTAAFAGLLLVVLARGLSRGYHAAFRATLILLTLASVAVILKGFDWEEAIILACIGIAARSQSELFQRPSRGDWIERPDLVLAFAALTIFVTFGTFSHRLGATTFERWSNTGYLMEGRAFRAHRGVDVARGCGGDALPAASPAVALHPAGRRPTSTRHWHGISRSATEPTP